MVGWEGHAQSEARGVEIQLSVELGAYTGPLHSPFPTLSRLLSKPAARRYRLRIDANTPLRLASRSIAQNHARIVQVHAEAVQLIVL